MATVKGKAMKNTNPFNNMMKQARTTYNKIYEDQKNNYANNYQQQQEQINNNYGGYANRAYVNYRKSLANARTQASNLGVTGGAVERMAVNNANTYNNNVANVNSGRAYTLNNAQNAYNTNLLNARMERDQSILNSNQALKQAQIDYNNNMRSFNYQKAQDKRNRKDNFESRAINIYADTVGRFKTLSQVNAEVKRVKKDKSLTKYQRSSYLAYLDSQKAAIAAKKKKA